LQDASVTGQRQAVSIPKGGAHAPLLFCILPLLVLA
jgi:hypothetical protein